MTSSSAKTTTGRTLMTCFQSVKYKEIGKLLTKKNF